MPRSTDPQIHALRWNLAWHLRMERGAVRRSRYFERRAVSGQSPRPDVARAVAAGFQRDAAKERTYIVAARAALADAQMAVAS